MNSKRIVVTGVSRGLGRGMIEGFIAAGHIVSGCSRSGDAIERLRNEYGRAHRFDVVDVRSDAAVQQWATEVLADGPVDLLINNAATINANAPLWEVPSDQFRRPRGREPQGHCQRDSALLACHGRMPSGSRGQF